MQLKRYKPKIKGKMEKDVTTDLIKDSNRSGFG